MRILLSKKELKIIRRALNQVKVIDDEDEKLLQKLEIKILEAIIDYPEDEEVPY